MTQICKSPVEYQEHHELGAPLVTTESAAGIIEDVKTAKCNTSPMLLGRVHGKHNFDFEA